MSQISAAPLRTTYCVFQIGSKLARSACGTKRSVRAAARCEIAGVASPPAASAAAVFRNALRCMVASHVVVGWVERQRHPPGPSRGEVDGGFGCAQPPLHGLHSRYTVLATPQKNGSGPLITPETFF